MKHKTVESLAAALGWDRSYLTKLKDTKGIKLPKPLNGGTYDEASLRVELKRHGMVPPRSPSADVLEEMEGAIEADGSRGTELPGFCSYDPAVKSQKIGYSEALKREQVVEQEFKNRLLETEISMQRGKLFTADQVHVKASAISTAMLNEVAKVERLCDGLDGITPAMRLAFIERFRIWRKGVGEVLVKVCG